ncbi:hypothetical protein LJB88_05565 [Erysipelotrichaceae bacterium OttesenSCG-928-M19]|nr:hypothetical protein [Erysipelotrichaceae bacterium OttesenSCG-928-M19]
MDKNEYIARLAKCLDEYEVVNKYDILADYEQIVDEILIDNDSDFNQVIEKLGYPEILALEIAQELGYSTKKENKQSKRSKDNVYSAKRQRSNIIWNIILACYYFMQFFFTIALISIVGLIIFFGFNSNVNISTKIVNQKVENTITICKDKQCTKYITSSLLDDDYDDYHDFSIQKCQNDSCQKVDDFTNTISFPISLFTIIALGVLIVLIWFNYLIVYKNVRKMIDNNNEYNRRRAYE